MSFPLFIAKRYFQTRTKKNFIHRIGLIACISVGLSTMALLLVLSIFNGLEALTKSLFRAFDPDIKIELKQGKTFVLAPTLRQQLTTVAGVAKVVDVLEDNALIRYQGRQIVAKLKGVTENFLFHNRLGAFITQGNFKLKQGNEALAIVGRGIYHALSINLATTFHPLQVFYPRNKKISTNTTGQLYRQKNIKPEAVFAVEKQFDEKYIIVPLHFAATLMGVCNKQTALEIQVKKGFSIVKVQQALKQCIPACFQVRNHSELHATLMQVLHIERFFLFLVFSFIMLVASSNIFFILSMLVLDKRKDTAILYALGATPRAIKKIFLIEGLLVALSGAAIGMVLAWLLSWLQQTTGILSLGIETSFVNAYPIKRKLSDFTCTAIIVVTLTLLAAYWPARLAAKTVISAQLVK